MPSQNYSEIYTKGKNFEIIIITNECLHKIKTSVLYK